jgi:hypothetical protein
VASPTGRPNAELPCENPQGGSRIVTRKPSAYAWMPSVPASCCNRRRAYRTQVNDLLLTALARVLCRWSGQPSALIQLEGHGRETLFDEIDLTRTVGWFTSAYPCA